MSTIAVPNRTVWTTTAAVEESPTWNLWTLSDPVWVGLSSRLLNSSQSVLSPTEGRGKEGETGGGEEKKNSVIRLWVMSGSHGWHPPLSFSFSALTSKCFHPPLRLPQPPSFSLILFSHLLYFAQVIFLPLLSVASPPLFPHPLLLSFFLVCCHSPPLFSFFACPADASQSQTHLGPRRHSIHKRSPKSKEPKGGLARSDLGTAHPKTALPLK